MSSLAIKENNSGSSTGALMAATRAEATKFFSLRSLSGLFLAGILTTIALSWVLGISAKASGDNGFDTMTPAPLLAFATLQFGQLFFASASALHITNEYSSGTIASSMQAVPQRRMLLGAKALLLFIVNFLAGVVMIALATVPTALSAGEYGTFDFADLVSAALGSGTYLALLSLMVLGLGLLCRNSAGAIVSTIMLVIGLPQILQLIPIQCVHDVVQYLPTNAATLMATGATEPYGPGTAVAVLVIWGAGLLGAGYLRFKGQNA
ncbi:hypothetical protein [Glutamicibacter arilaitensis]|uniref:hypothetical protein n=1 Tax=Glutamicibacter arilaitensis TaxID=256701 RepID=UPI001866361D|nr:hypothetical protein [Glutamicibacter arilaitensis]